MRCFNEHRFCRFQVFVGYGDIVSVSAVADFIKTSVFTAGALNDMSRHTVCYKFSFKCFRHTFNFLFCEFDFCR